MWILGLSQTYLWLYWLNFSFQSTHESGIWRPKTFCESSFFHFYVTPFSHILKNSFFLLHRKSNLTSFFGFMWKIVIMCRLRSHFSDKLKNNSFNLWYFWSWISLDLKRYLAGETFFEIKLLFWLAPFYFSIRRHSA